MLWYVVVIRRKASSERRNPGSVHLQGIICSFNAPDAFIILIFYLLMPDLNYKRCALKKTY